MLQTTLCLLDNDMSNMCYYTVKDFSLIKNNLVYFALLYLYVYSIGLQSGMFRWICSLGN